MRIGVIGLGGIAQKAYLPVIAARDDVELYFCTRNQGVLRSMAKKYRPVGSYKSVDELIEHGMDAVFVHAATEGHLGLVRQLMENGIHVYLDKPITYHYEESKELVELANRKGCIFLIGFNRRFAPMVAELKDHSDHRLIMMQKNRLPSPDQARRFILDDFIHVVDTLRFLAPGKIQETRISTLVDKGLLYQVKLELEGDGFICIGIMNRDSGFSEERLEVTSPGRKWVVDQLNELRFYEQGREMRTGFNDWDTVLYRRGFEQIIDHFIACVRGEASMEIDPWDALESHMICELIVQKAEEARVEHL